MKIKSLSIRTLTVVILICPALFFPGCNKLENLTQSASKLIIDWITGSDVHGDPESTTVFSDVITSSGSVFNDVGTVTLSVVLLNPNREISTFYQDIIVDQVDIEYTRTDGLNVPGQDVPFGFSQKVHIRIPIDGTGELSFVLVQHNAKTESPLVELITYGHEHILKTEARITFYGKDLSGNRVEPAVGTISVWFANFGDDN